MGEDIGISAKYTATFHTILTGIHHQPATFKFKWQVMNLLYAQQQMPYKKSTDTTTRKLAAKSAANPCTLQMTHFYSG